MRNIFQLKIEGAKKRKWSNKHKVRGKKISIIIRLQKLFYK